MTIVIASLNTAIERLLLVEQHRPGEVHRLQDDRTLAGGKGVNVARVLSQLRAGELPSCPAPQLVGFLGGATGMLCRALLAQENLGGQWVDTAGATRICEVIIERQNADNATVYNARGPAIAPEERTRLHQALGQILPGASALVCTGSLPAGMAVGEYGDWIALARQQGVPSLLDTHGEALLQAAQHRPDIIKINRDELQQVSGTSLAALPQQWLAQGVRSVIITNGRRPTVAFTPDGLFAITPPRVATRSAVGSGDAHCAGLIASLCAHPQAPWTDHLRLAAACGAANAASLTAGLAPDSALDVLQQQCAVHAVSTAYLNDPHSPIE
ncbi:1-phosphofructokinase family hexose kinase [Sodalis praecaptivus]|uniref:Phosphofructokinase n=1 Tax=Sodalis praecaptivus TaxID=1239307 RepID=W0HPM5_9GAMM|nr:PfkB family carbohydrate kinase [Sodalis praecaptivus]AHF75774.1 1-phosphofructokinase family hexose kinase [Sodalis praecaptivus]